MFDNLLCLLLDDPLQSSLTKTEILQMLQSEPPLLLPQLSVRGDDALKTAIISQTLIESFTLLTPLSDLKYLDMMLWPLPHHSSLLKSSLAIGKS